MTDNPLQTLLDDVERWTERFIVMSDPARTIVVLWIAHTWAFEAFETTPRLLIRSPVRESGKSRLLEIIRALSRAPLMASNTSTAALFRTTDAGRPTILLDEVDNFLSGADGSERNDIHGLINDGFYVNGQVIRCVGDSNNVKTFSVFAPLALAGLSKVKLQDTTLSRSFIIDMQRKRPDEHVDRYRLRDQAEPSAEFRARLEQWGDAAKAALSESRPDLPDELGDRQQDILEPLAAIADMAEGDWPERVRTSAVELHEIAAGRTVDEGTLSERLLADLRTVFGEDDKLATSTLLERLWKVEDAPWFEMPHTGKALDARGLARLLKPWGVRSRNVWTGTTLKGYQVKDLHDVWVRHLPPPLGPLGPLDEPVEGDSDPDSLAEPSARRPLGGDGPGAPSGDLAAASARESAGDSPRNGHLADLADLADTPRGGYRCEGCDTPIDRPYWCDECGLDPVVRDAAAGGAA